MSRSFFQSAAVLAVLFLLLWTVKWLGGDPFWVLVGVVGVMQARIYAMDEELSRIGVR